MSVETLSEREQYERAREAKERLYGFFPPIVKRRVVAPPAKPYAYRRTYSGEAWAVAMRVDPHHVRLERLAKELGNRRVSFEDIMRVVCTFYRIPKDDILSARRTRDIVWARQVTMYLTRELLNFSWLMIGRLMGGKHHTTVMHDHRAVNARMADSSLIREEISGLMKMLGAQ